MNQSGFGRMLATMHYHLYTRPVEEGRAVVDIECRCHKIQNTANVDVERNKSDDSEEKPADWFDEFSITSSKEMGMTKTKSYQLQLSSSTTKGANFNFKIAGAQEQGSSMWLHQALA